MAVASVAVLVGVEAVGEAREARHAFARVGQHRDQRPVPLARGRMGARVPQMDADDPLVVEIIAEIGDRPVEPIQLGPVDWVKEHRAEEPLLQRRTLVGGEVVGQQLRPDIAERGAALGEEPLERLLVKRAHVAAVGLGIDNVAADEMPFMPTPPLQIEEVVAAEWEWAQHHHVGVHPQPAMLVERGIAEDVGKIPDFGARDDALEQALRDNIRCIPQLDPVRREKIKLRRRIAPHPHRMPRRPHRLGRGDQARVLRRLGHHLVEAMDLREGRRIAVADERRDPLIERARLLPSVLWRVHGAQEWREREEFFFGRGLPVDRGRRVDARDVARRCRTGCVLPTCAVANRFAFRRVRLDDATLFILHCGSPRLDGIGPFDQNQWVFAGTSGEDHMVPAGFSYLA